MPNYAIDLWTPVLWQGHPPPFARQHIATQVRPGSRNAQHTRIGEWGDETTVRTTNYYSTFALAEAARRLVVEQLPAKDLVVVFYGGVNYYQKYQHKYKVTRVNIIEVQTIVYWMGNGTTMTNPTALVADISLVGHVLG